MRRVRLMRFAPLALSTSYGSAVDWDGDFVDALSGAVITKRFKYLSSNKQDDQNA
jgi:hypothetical protein